jgi:type VI secretion system protein ImpH
MEPARRGTGPALIDRLAEESRRFEFVQAAILLHRFFARESGERAFRYASGGRLDYPSAEVELERLPDEETSTPGRLLVSFLGLTGLMGALPAHYTELVQDRERSDDMALSRFLGVFEDRLVDLFLAAHRRNRYWLDFAWLATGREARPPEGHGFQEMVLALIGTGTGDLRRRAGLPALAQVYYAGILAQQPCSADALSRVLADYFGVPAAANQFEGAWVGIPADAQRTAGGPAGGRLGEDLLLGDRYFDPSLGFRLELGPMRLQDLQRLLPGTTGADVLDRFVRFAAGPDQEFHYALTLAPDEVPPPRLTSEPSAPQRLGWTLWLRAGDEPGEAVSGPFAARPIDTAIPQPSSTR